MKSCVPNEFINTALKLIKMECLKPLYYIHPMLFGNCS